MEQLPSAADVVPSLMEYLSSNPVLAFLAGFVIAPTTVRAIQTVFKLLGKPVASLFAPVSELNKIIPEVHQALLFHADLLGNLAHESERADRLKAREALRTLASRIEPRAEAVHFYDAFARVRLVRSRQDMDRAADNLYGLSNGTFPRNHWDLRVNDRKRWEVEKALGLPLSSRERPELSDTSDTGETRPTYPLIQSPEA